LGYVFTKLLDLVPAFDATGPALNQALIGPMAGAGPTRGRQTTDAR
jgi:hypothetical protein